MSKYLRTVQKVNGINQKILLKVNSCHNCPLMKFHQQECVATCRVFESSQGNTVDDFVLDYNINTGEIHDKIEIPEWCRLADHKDQMDFDVKTYTIFNDKVLTSDAIIDNDLPVYLADDVVENEEMIDVQSFLPALITANTFLNNSDAAYEEAYSEYENDDSNFNHSTTVSKHGICSLCGEEDETVNRNTNHGMCDNCWEVSHDNEKRKKQAYINNFRMKRGESFKMELFNLSISI